MMDHTDNRDAIGLVAILCSLLVIAMFVAGISGLCVLVPKLIGYKASAWWYVLPFLRVNRRDDHRGDQPHPGDVAVFLFAVVAFVVLLVSGVFQ